MEILASVLGGLFAVASGVAVFLGLELKRAKNAAVQTEDLYVRVVAALEGNKLTKKEVVSVTREAVDVVEALRELVQRIGGKRRKGTVYYGGNLEIK